MAIAGRIAFLATMRAVLGEPHFAGASSAPAAVSFRPCASASAPAPLLHLPPYARSAAARSSVAVVRASGGNPFSGGAAGKRSSGAEGQDAGRSAAARSSVAVVSAFGGNLFSGGAGKRSSGAEGQDAVADPSDPAGRGHVTLAADEAERTARIVAFFLFIQKAFYLREKKMSDIMRKFLMMGFIGLALWTGFMAAKGNEWAVIVAETFDKADKIYKIINAIASVFK